jgi:adenylate cyclase
MEPTAAPNPGTLTTHDVTVLLIDDQRLIGEAVRRMLADEPDIRFHYLDDPMRAIEVAQEIQPTVILQDLVMPQIDGLSLVSTFRANEATRDIPMIVLSSKEEAKTKAEAFARGANDYMVKLPDRLEVLARIRYHSRGYISLLERNEALQKLEIRNRFIRETFGRYLSDDVVNNLLDAPEGLRLGGEKREVTILMSDLRGFTAISEVYGAEQVVTLLNNYLGTMTDIILHYGGTIDEFIGDAILVLFGAPQQREDDAARAVACALAMQQEMAKVNAWNAAQGLPEVEMGIGLNTGHVIVGNIGSQRRTKYAAVGSHVNLTGRIESFTVGGQVLISGSTRDAITAELQIESETLVEPKGVKEPITLFEVSGIGAPFDVRLARDADPMHLLATPLPLSFSLLEGKQALQERSAGTLVAVSSREAELRTETPLPPMSNLRLRLESHPEADIYAKVLAREAVASGARVLRFTSLPAEVATHLATLPRIP